MSAAETITGEIIGTFAPKAGRADRAIVLLAPDEFALIEKQADGGWKQKGKTAQFAEGLAIADAILAGDQRLQTDPCALARVCLALVGFELAVKRRLLEESGQFTDAEGTPA